MQPSAKPGRDPNLDILRSVAVLAVFLTHTLQVTAGRKAGEHFAYGVETFSLGHAGVLLFFVHTSLVLMQSLERTGTKLIGWPLIRNFYIRRAFRIYPLSVCLVLLSIVFSIPPNALNVTYRWFGVDWMSSNILLIQNLTSFRPVSSPLWSLPYEVQMCLALPIIFLLLRAPGGSAGLPLIYVTGSLLSLFCPLFRYFPCFLAGVVAYKLVGAWQPRFPALLWCPAVIIAVVLYVEAPFSDASWLKDVLICMGVGLLIPLFRGNGGVTAAIASQIAKYSYGIYLCHTPLLWLLYRRLIIPGWQRAIWLVIGTGFVSVMCYLAIEGPLIGIGKRVANMALVQPADYHRIAPAQGNTD
jgi:peptidoglycan/LPS O-acetylase OafA/YrhL